MYRFSLFSLGNTKKDNIILRIPAQTTTTNQIICTIKKRIGAITVTF